MNLKRIRTYKETSRKYFRKVEAVEFAVKYDDGKDTRGIKSRYCISSYQEPLKPFKYVLAHKH